MASDIIYRGFNIRVIVNMQFPYKVLDTQGNMIYAARTEDEAYSFIDWTKRNAGLAR